MKTLLLLPNQLYNLDKLDKLDKLNVNYDKIYLVLHEKYLDRYKYNKNRLLFMMGCIYAFADEYKVTLINKFTEIL